MLPNGEYHHLWVIASSHFGEGLQVFKEMVGEEVSPNQAALVNVLTLRAHLRGLNMGFGFIDHGYIERHGIELDDILDASLIDMYSNEVCYRVLPSFSIRKSRKGFLCGPQ